VRHGFRFAVGTHSGSDKTVEKGKAGLGVGLYVHCALVRGLSKQFARALFADDAARTAGWFGARSSVESDRTVARRLIPLSVGGHLKLDWNNRYPYMCHTWLRLARVGGTAISRHGC
jgi:hypothetical protein